MAISNHLLPACDNGQVRFTWGDRRKQISLPAEEFTRRFLTHVLALWGGRWEAGYPLCGNGEQ